MTKSSWILIALVGLALIAYWRWTPSPQPRGEAPASTPALTPPPTATRAPSTTAGRRRGIVPEEVQAALRQAFVATATGGDDGVLRIASPRCAVGQLARVLDPAGRMLLVGAGFTRVLCEGNAGEPDRLELLDSRGLRRRAVAGEIEEELRRQGRPVDEVGILGSAGEVLYLLSQQCTESFVREVLPGERTRALQTRDGFIAIRCDVPGAPSGAFIQLQ